MANRFWVGGTGTWDASTTTHWAATSGGAGGQSVPGSADAVTFDGSSGGGTVTVNTTINVTSISMGTFTGTLDFSANNNNVTLTSFNANGSSTRTLNMGNGTWTITGTGTVWTIASVSGLTFNANSSVLVFTATSIQTRTFSGGSLTYSTISLSANTSRGTFQITGANTFGTFNVTAPCDIIFPASSTNTITNAFTWTGTSGNTISLQTSSTGAQSTISTASGSPNMSWACVREMAFTGGATFSATNSFDSGRNSGITISAPSGGGSIIAGVIGG